MSHDCTDCWEKLTDGFTAARKIEGSWWKVPQVHRKFMKVYGRSRSHVEFWRMILLLHRKLTKIPCHTKSWQRVPRPHGKLSNFEEMSHSWMESWQKLMEGRVSCMEIWQKSTEGPAYAEKVERIWQNIMRMHGKLTEGHGRSSGRTGSWR